MDTATSQSPERRLQMLRDLMDAAEIILRDRAALRDLAREQAELERRRVEAQRQLDEDTALYRDAVAVLGSDPAGILDDTPLPAADGDADPVAADVAPAEKSRTDRPEEPRLPRAKAHKPNGTDTSVTGVILRVLRDAGEPLDAGEIATRSGLRLGTVRPALTRMKQQGRIAHAGSRSSRGDGRRVGTYRPASAAERRGRDAA